MTLETMIHNLDPFINCCSKNYHYNLGMASQHEEKPNAENLGIKGEEVCSIQYWDSPPEICAGGGGVAPLRRKRRRRAKILKNKEEMENQRMTHIAVERNRRRQMNEYLAILRSLMPPSYAQRGDQASIVGGAINFVKELEQLLQSLEAHKLSDGEKGADDSDVFSDFFSFPQYSMRPSTETPAVERRSSVAEIEVTMVESHANIKILSKRRPKQLLKMVAGLQSIRLNILHLNVTTLGLDLSVLYTFSVKVEEECQLITVNEIATAVHEMVGMIQEESTYPPHEYLVDAN
ncbi:hypothetical protein ACS0TY_031545 [Phlomoides rotata]